MEKSSGNTLKLQEDVLTSDVLLMGSDNVIGKTYGELKPLLSLNLVDNTSDINKPISTATLTQLALKQDNLTCGKINGNALKLQQDVTPPKRGCVSGLRE